MHRLEKAAMLVCTHVTRRPCWFLTTRHGGYFLFCKKKGLVASRGDTFVLVRQNGADDLDLKLAIGSVFHFNRLLQVITSAAQ